MAGVTSPVRTARPRIRKSPSMPLRCEARLALVLLAMLLPALPAAAQDPAKPAALDVPITFLAREEEPRIPLSLAEPTLEDEGIMGARQGIADNQTTGRFLNQGYRLVERIVPADGDPASVVKEALAAGERLFVSDLRKDDLLAVAPLTDGAGALLFNGRAEDDELRTDAALCHASLLHTAPSRAMKADALAQYLVWKRLARLVPDRGLAPRGPGACRRPTGAPRPSSARRSSTEQVYEDTGGARRTDTGHVQVQQQMPVFTQDASDHDVLIVADESDVFAEYLPYHTWDAAAGGRHRRAWCPRAWQPRARAVGRHADAAPLRASSPAGR